MVILDDTCSRADLKFQISLPDTVYITGNEMTGALSYKGGYLIRFRK